MRALNYIDMLKCLGEYYVYFILEYLRYNT